MNADIKSELVELVSKAKEETGSCDITSESVDKFVSFLNDPTLEKYELYSGIFPPTVFNWDKYSVLSKSEQELALHHKNERARLLQKQATERKQVFGNKTNKFFNKDQAVSIATITWDSDDMSTTQILVQTAERHGEDLEWVSKVRYRKTPHTHKNMKAALSITLDTNDTHLWVATHDLMNTPTKLNTASSTSVTGMIHSIKESKTHAKRIQTLEDEVAELKARVQIIEGTSDSSNWFNQAKILRTEQGMTYKQISKRLGISESRVGKRFRRENRTK